MHEQELPQKLFLGNVDDHFIDVRVMKHSSGLHLRRVYKRKLKEKIGHCYSISCQCH